ncbi:sensor histidine kinase [Terrabacter carboxydivorans]|uniref:Histidine kinase/HSP90-like ATPase domain-containing protein n=1 Tax=Terrabacter carboxydivorans TaxID=619730 RepID=A0ABN3MEC0_9MICO
MARARRRGGELRTGSRPIVREAISRFALWTLAAFLIVTVCAVLVARTLAADLALREASLRGRTFALNVAAPFVDRAVRAGDRGSTASLVTVVQSRRRDGSLVHVKLWSADGQVIWSDEEALIGRTYAMDEEVKALFGTQQVFADLSDLTKVENAAERASGQLLEVYVGAFDADHRPIVIESYWSTARLESDTKLVLLRLTALAIGSMLVLTLFLLPLALSLARGVDHAQAERNEMLRHALAASDLERRRIAEELHDGLIQNLAALGYALPLIARELPEDSHGAREMLDSTTPNLQGEIAALRGLVTDLYPADPSRGGLLSALDILATRAGESGVTVDVDVSERYASVSKEAIQLTYRVLREGLRNVVKHAAASTARLTARVDGRDVVVSVRDDGVGPPASPAAAGHFGLRLLEDTLKDVGGSLTLVRLPDGGTELVARFPQNFQSVFPA